MYEGGVGLSYKANAKFQFPNYIKIAILFHLKAGP
jgi:hypothetical protein